MFASLIVLPLCAHRGKPCMSAVRSNLTSDTRKSGMNNIMCTMHHCNKRQYCCQGGEMIENAARPITCPVPERQGLPAGKPTRFRPFPLVRGRVDEGPGLW